MQVTLNITAFYYLHKKCLLRRREMHSGEGDLTEVQFKGNGCNILAGIIFQDCPFITL